MNVGKGGFEAVIQAPVNIALVKYWGKRNEELILPLNDSISVSINELVATTDVSVGPHIGADSVMLNGTELDLSTSSRFKRVFDEVRKANRKRTANGESISKQWHFKIVSETNFPTAAGLASSAAGFAAIAFGLGQIFHLSEGEIVRLARIGSGSACRSILNGFVHWKAGAGEGDDSDCVCESIAVNSHWPQLRAVIVVVSEEGKKIGSSEGMRNTVRTSQLLKTRVSELVPKRVADLKEAIRTKDFAKLAEITIAESNQLHALCLDTNPPLNYLNATSHSLIEFVYSFNAHYGTRLAYTFDAGPNCCLLLEEGTLPLLKHVFNRCFASECAFPGNDDPPSLPETDRATGADFPWKAVRNIDIKRIVVSEVGIGPRVVKLNSREKEGQQQNFLGGGASATVNCKML